MQKIGGQAVMEGVMMKSPKKVATAVRILKTNEVKIRVKDVKKVPKIFKLPLLRGIYVLIDSLVSGLEALTWSSNQNLDDGEKIKKGEMVLTLLVSLVVGVGLFLGIPFLVTKLFLGRGLGFSLLEGLLRVGLFLGYLGLISLSKEVQKLFQYHGAEHMTIHCYEQDKEVNVKNVRLFSTLHPRCGTAFVFIVLILSILVFSFVETGWWRILWKLLLIPVIAGFSYELLKLGDRFQGNFLVRWLVWPGLMLQKITTKKPTEGQIEVAIKAWEKVV